METSQKKLFDQIFRPPKGREDPKKWFEIVHWVVMNVFEPFNPHIMYRKLVLTEVGGKSGPPACCGTVTFARTQFQEFIFNFFNFEGLLPMVLGHVGSEISFSGHLSLIAACQRTTSGE